MKVIFLNTRNLRNEKFNIFFQNLNFRTRSEITESKLKIPEPDPKYRNTRTGSTPLYRNTRKSEIPENPKYPTRTRTGTRTPTPTFSFQCDSKNAMVRTMTSEEYVLVINDS